MSAEAEFYPMPSFPMLAATDPEASAEWYQRVLGFRHVFAIPGPDGRALVIHLRWTKYADVLLTRSNPAATAPKGVGVTLYYRAADATVDQLAQRAIAAGAHIADGPADKPWNAREVTILDPDGYRLTFTQPLDPSKDFRDVVAAVQDTAKG